MGWAARVALVQERPLSVFAVLVVPGKGLYKLRG